MKPMPIRRQTISTQCRLKGLQPGDPGWPEQAYNGDYIADIARKEEMNKAWDEWVDRANPPMRACLGVHLEPPHLVEIVVTAVQ